MHCFHIWVKVMPPTPIPPPKVFLKRKSISKEICPGHKGSHSRHSPDNLHIVLYLTGVKSF